MFTCDDLHDKFEDELKLPFSAIYLIKKKTALIHERIYSWIE